MTYGQIITLLFILLILYYAGLVTMDIMAAKRMKASEEAKNEEAEIDISGLAGTALSFKISSHSRQMCCFIARAVRTERDFNL